jgi:hypothetical protein
VSIYSTTMIIRREGQKLLAVTQPDHARLAGIFTEALRDPPGRSLVAAAHHHDDGWIDWEEAPTVDAEGRPHDFLTIPMDERVAIYRRGVDLLAATDQRAALLTSLHFGRLLAEGLDALQEDARHRAESFLAEQGAGEQPAAVEADYQVLRAMDYLSLLLCMRPQSELDGTPVATMRMGVDDRRVTLDPYPFALDELAVSVSVRALAATTFESGKAYRSALGAAPIEERSFTLSRPRR